MTVDIEKLKAALAENTWVRNPREVDEVEKAARAYLAMQPSDEGRKRALEWLEQAFLEEKQAELEDVFNIGVPPSTDYSEINKALSYIETIRAALINGGWQPIPAAPVKIGE